ncbi:MAG: ribonuclease P protein component [Congregibacter sp.]
MLHWIFRFNAVSSDFQRHRRLITASHYRNVFDQPDKKSGERAFLLLAKRNNLPVNRLGLAIAKKHVPTAVRRNLIKRLIREQFRKIESTDSNWDVVVLTRPAAINVDRAALAQSLQKQFGKIGL